MISRMTIFSVFVSMLCFSAYSDGAGCAIGFNTILTASDVVDGASSVEVCFGDAQFRADVFRQDSSSGWAILKTEDRLPAVARFDLYPKVSAQEISAHSFSGKYRRCVYGSICFDRQFAVFSEQLSQLPSGSPVFARDGSLIGMLTAPGSPKMLRELTVQLDLYKDDGQNASNDRGAYCVVRSNRGAKSERVAPQQVEKKPTVSDKTKKVYEKVQNQLAVIQTKNGSGSGFIASMDGKVYLITNEHVVRDGEPLVAKLFTGEVLRIQLKRPPLPKGAKKYSRAQCKFEIAEGRDLVRFELKDVVGLNISSTAPTIDSEVHVFGNSDGGGVCTLLSGRVLAVGPDQIEVDAPFVPGNSGSPICDENGGVLGVATMVSWYDGSPKLLEGTRFGEKRWFGYRLNHVDWTPMFWEDYEERSGYLNDFATFLGILETFKMPDEDHVRDITLGYTEADGRRFSHTQSFHLLLLRVAKTHKELLDSYDKILAKKPYDPRKAYHPSRELVERYEKWQRSLRSITGTKWREYAAARNAVFKDGRRNVSSKKWGCGRLKDRADALLERLDYILKKSNLNL